jgi:hypothetical protein
MTLLISAAALDTPVPICGDRHKFATGRSGPAREANAEKHLRQPTLFESDGSQPAEGLSKVWRFFVTYAMVETGPLSRHVPQRA